MENILYDYRSNLFQIFEDYNETINNICKSNTQKVNTRWPPQPSFHKYCSINYSNAIQAIVSRFDVQVSNHNTLLVLFFLELKQNGRLDGTCKFCWLSILTTSDQLKEKLWIYHHQTLYTDIRWHKLGWYWISAISEKQDGRHSQFSTNIVRLITAMPFKLSSPDLTCR